MVIRLIPTIISAAFLALPKIYAAAYSIEPMISIPIPEGCDKLLGSETRVIITGACGAYRLDMARVRSENPWIKIELPKSPEELEEERLAEEAKQALESQPKSGTQSETQEAPPEEAKPVIPPVVTEKKVIPVEPISLSSTSNTAILRQGARLFLLEFESDGSSAVTELDKEPDFDSFVIVDRGPLATIYSTNSKGHSLKKSKHHRSSSAGDARTEAKLALLAKNLTGIAYFYDSRIDLV